MGELSLVGTSTSKYYCFIVIRALIGYDRLYKSLILPINLYLLSRRSLVSVTGIGVFE